jgi:hypothetical protein
MKISKLKKLAQRASGIADQMEIEAQDLRDTWEDKSERWRESDRGCAADDYLAEIDDLVQIIADGIADLETHTNERLV